MSGSDTGLLARMQRRLARLYDVDAVDDVRRFVITDPQLARVLTGERSTTHIRERLLVAQEPDDDTLSLSLYVDADVLARLAAADPFRRLDNSNLGDFLIALEGVSHFVYVAFNAAFDKKVTRLELELQAEVDKYILVLMLLTRQQPRGVPARLHDWLFAHPRLAAGLADDCAARYRHANRYAALYCRRLQQRFFSRSRSRGLMRELRRFYRLPQPGKLRHIEASIA